MATETNTGLTYQEAGSLQTDVLQNAELNLFGPAIAGTVTREFASDANITLIAAEFWTSVLILTDSPTTLTTGRDVVFPAHFPQIYVKNSTAQTLTLKKSGQTGITLAAGADCMIASGATDVVRTSGGSSNVSSVNGSSGVVVLGGESIAEPVTALTSSSGVCNINCALGDYFTFTLTENVTSITFSNLPASGKAQTIMVRILQHASSPKTVAFPSSFKWAGGTTGVVSASNSAYDVLAITTFDQGTRWEATLAKAFT